MKGKKDAIQPELEATIVARITEALKEEGVQFLFKMHGESFQANGLPDLIGIAPGGRFFALEVKRPVLGRISALQVRCIDRINAAGGFADAAWDEEMAVSLLHQAMEGWPHKVDWEVQPEWLMKKIWN